MRLRRRPEQAAETPCRRRHDLGVHRREVRVERARDRRTDGRVTSAVRARATRRRPTLRPGRRSPFAAGRPARATARTAALSRACPFQRQPPRRLVFGIGRRAFDPRVAVLEELVLPDRRDLFHPLDRVPAGLKGLGAVRASRRRWRRWPRQSPGGRPGGESPPAHPASARRFSCAIRWNTFSASGPNASYSRYRTRRPWCVARTVPTKEQSAPQPSPRVCATASSAVERRSIDRGSATMASRSTDIDRV